MHWSSTLPPELGANVTADDLWSSVLIDLIGKESLYCEKYKPRWRTRSVPDYYVRHECT